MSILPIKSWLPELALRTLRVVAIGFMLLNGWSIYKAYTNVRSPLFPENLVPYVAFPHYFIIAFYVVIIFIIWKFLKGTYESKHFWVPILAVFLFEFFKFYVYGFLMWINPFG